MFRFIFWEAVWYFEPTATYPKPNFLPGRFVGIAWDHGDAFTYRIWTTPQHHWELGQELIRNIVRGRIHTDVMPATVLESHDLAFHAKGDPGFKYSKTHATSLRSAATHKAEGSPFPPHVPTVHFKSPLFSVFNSDEELGGVGMKVGMNDKVALHTGKRDEQPTAESIAVTDPTSNPNKRVRDEPVAPVIDYSPQEEAEVVMTDEVNNQLLDAESSEVGGARVTAILKHEWYQGELKLNVQWDTEESTWERLRDMKEDHPRLTAQYIVDNNVTRSKRMDRNLQWAKSTLRDLNHTVRRMARLYNGAPGEDLAIHKVRKKKKINYSMPVFKYGVQVPRNVRQAIELDTKNGNSFWSDAIKVEIGGLIKLDCFEFKPKTFTCGADYQKTTLHMIFDVKHDLRRKARLVAGGHLVDAFDIDIYSSTVKSISVKLLHVIAHKMNLKQLCGDVASAYVNAYTNEKVYAVAGPEFGAEEGSIVLIRKALYGLRSSSERWHAHFSDTLRSMLFAPTRYDKDVWIRRSVDGTHYEYVCTHSDDFMIVGRKPQAVMEMLKKVYTIKSEGEPDYYLGNDYKKIKGRWAIGCKKYLSEALSRVEAMFGVLRKYSIPLSAGDHPELDTTDLLGDDEHRKYQMLLGMLNWVVTIGRYDIAHATSSMSRFASCPRKGHLERALRIFGFLKKRSNRRYVIDSRDPIFIDGEEDFAKDYVEELQNDYPDSVEEIDRNIPEPLIDEMIITTFVDSDHAHDQVTRRSITGVMIFVGRTPVLYLSKRQGAVATSTYGAEFCAMRTGTEETISVRYMLRCLGVRVEHASYMFGDNLGVVQNATIKDSLLKKKHVAISYHQVREAAAAGIVHPIKIDSKDNYADLLTKSLSERVFCTLSGQISYG
jgi:Reverse transcriptase (RNA-dependent DNA polymerase)